MATYRENIRKIQGEAIYGKDVREAIAAAIEQAAKLDVDSGRLYVRANQVESTDDYVMEVLQN